MFRSTLMSLGVVVGALVLATSVATQRPTSAATAAAVARPDLQASPGPPGSATGERARWHWPLHPRPPVLRPFRAPVSTYGAGHRGLDLAAADGAPVLAVERGVVTHAGVVAGRGTVTIAHEGGLRSTYEPVAPVVAAGDAVATGEVVGTVQARDGPGHCGLRVCLHLGARHGASYLDPRPLLVGGRLALLPLG